MTLPAAKLLALALIASVRQFVVGLNGSGCDEKILSFSSLFTWPAKRTPPPRTFLPPPHAATAENTEPDDSEGNDVFPCACW